ncbi:MAG TPA: LysE family translocator, partial [Flavobacteriia bacterium]|nr:LysE family translocator [Flavobacteriia bacterium]
NGKKYGIISALGLVSGIIVHTTLIALGVSELIKQSENIFLVIKLFGSLYLFYLAYKVYQAPATINLSQENVKKEEFLTLYKRAFWMNVLNPKVALFFLAFFPGFIDVSEANVIYQIYLLGLLFIVQAFIIFSAVAIVAAKMTIFLRENKHFAKSMKIFQIIIFILIGIWILI